MKSRAEIIDLLQNLNADNFHIVAMEVFRYQYNHNDVYQKYVQNLIGGNHIEDVCSPIYLPIEAYKLSVVKSGIWEDDDVFTSSGTTSNAVSKHHVRSISDYLDSCANGWNQYYGSIEDYSYLCLLPGYMERPGSSLIAMMKSFVNQSNHKSGFYLDNHDDLYDQLVFNKGHNIPTVLFGVSFGLMDFIEKHNLEFSNLIIMETGGMKGRREELLKEELHHKIAEAFGVNKVHSEYGMTELFSQAYSNGDGLFYPSSTMQIKITEITDPLTNQKDGKTGIVNIADLSNLDTCSFIMSQDLGIRYEDGSFRLMGRLDQSDIRGCNLMVL